MRAGGSWEVRGRFVGANVLWSVGRRSRAGRVRGCDPCPNMFERKAIHVVRCFLTPVVPERASTRPPGG